MHGFRHINHLQIINTHISCIKIHHSKIDNLTSSYVKSRIAFLIERSLARPFLFSAKNEPLSAPKTPSKTSESDYMVFSLFQRNIVMLAEGFSGHQSHRRIPLGILSANHCSSSGATVCDFGRKQRDSAPSLRLELIHGRGSSNHGWVNHRGAGAEQQNETESNNKPNSHREIMHRKTPVNDRFIALLGQMEGFVAPLRSLLTIAGGLRQSAVDATVSQRRCRMA